MMDAREGGVRNLPAHQLQPTPVLDDEGLHGGVLLDGQHALGHSLVALSNPGTLYSCP